MKQSFHFNIEAVSVTVGKFPITLKGIGVDAECEYSAEEMTSEGAVVNSVIDQLSEKLGWIRPLIEKEININIRNKDLLSRDLEKQIAEGTTRAYGPNGWSVRNSDLHGQQTKACKCDKKH